MSIINEPSHIYQRREEKNEISDISDIWRTKKNLFFLKRISFFSDIWRAHKNEISDISDIWRTKTYLLFLKHISFFSDIWRTNQNEISDISDN